MKTKRQTPDARQDRHPDLIQQIRQQLDIAFTWEFTKEGERFWLQVHEALGRIADKGR